MVRDSDRIELAAAKSDHAFHLPAAARPHHRPPGRPHRLPSQLAGHEAPTNAEGVKAVLRGIRRPIGATKQDKTPVTAGLVTETDICSQAAPHAILDRQRLRRIGFGLGSQYVLLPGLAQFNEEILDKFEEAGSLRRLA